MVLTCVWPLTHATHTGCEASIAMSSSACTSRCALPTAGTAAFSSVSLLWWLSTTAMPLVLLAAHELGLEPVELVLRHRAVGARPPGCTCRGRTAAAPARRRRSTRCGRCSRLSWREAVPDRAGHRRAVEVDPHEVGLVEQLARRVRRHGAQPGSRARCPRSTTAAPAGRRSPARRARRGSRRRAPATTPPCVSPTALARSAADTGSVPM